MQAPREYDIHHDIVAAGRAAGALFTRPWLVVALTGLGATLALLVALARTPVYRTSASLRVGDELAKSPVLEELDIPTGTTDVAEALTVLTSHELAALVVAPPTDGAVATPEHPEYERHMGLVTWVEDEGRAPLARRLRSLARPATSDFRLFASVDAARSESPRVVRARFAGPGRVVLSLVSSRPGIEWPDDRPTEFAWRPGVTLAYAGLELRLEPRGAWDGRSYRIERLEPDEAVDRLHSRVRAEEVTGRDGLLRLAVEDTDPERAAAIARAVVATYMELDAEGTRLRADSVVAYVQQELAPREEELERLEHAVARARGVNPDALNVEGAFVELHERETTAGAELARVRRLRSALEEASQRLASGERAAVSRLGPELDDPLTRRFLDYVAVLEDEAQRVAREGPGALQSTLRIELAQARNTREALDARVAALDEVIAALEDGEPAALGRLGDEHTRDGAVHVDALTLQLIADYGTAERRLGELRTEFTEEYHEVGTARTRLAALAQSILEHLRARRAGVAEQRAFETEVVTEWERLLEAHPERELAQVQAAIESHWARIERAVRERLAGVRADERALLRELDVVKSRIAELPEAERRVADPTERRAVLRKVVAQLREKREQAAVARAGAMPNARLIDPPSVPREPVRPSPLLHVVVGALLGLLVSLASGQARPSARSVARRAGDLEEASGLAVLATVPRFPRALRLARRPWPHFQAPGEAPSGPAAEAYRTLRARLRWIERRGGELRAIGVTSCLRGEGRSATAAGLAMTFASEGLRVLLVDADLRRPVQHEAFTLEAGPGLSELARGTATLEACAQPSGTPPLDVIGAGAPVESPDALLARALPELLETARERYDAIVVDLPPVAGAPDVEAVGHALDGLLVVHGELSPPEGSLVAQVCERLAHSGARLAGLVRNGAREAAWPGVDRRRAA